MFELQLQQHQCKKRRATRRESRVCGSIHERFLNAYCLCPARPHQTFSGRPHNRKFNNRKKAVNEKPTTDANSLWSLQFSIYFSYLTRACENCPNVIQSLERAKSSTRLSSEFPGDGDPQFDQFLTVRPILAVWRSGPPSLFIRYWLSALTAYHPQSRPLKITNLEHRIGCYIRTTIAYD
jgi:hypothetical protein